MILTDEQELAVIHATRPLQANERMTFMNALEALLAGRHEVGDGELFRALRDLQRKHFRPVETTA
jgi:hypothetical protein